MLHAGETTIGLPFTRDQAAQLDTALQALLKTVSGARSAFYPPARTSPRTISRARQHTAPSMQHT